MSPATIAQLIIVLGPPALELISRLSAVWNKPELTAEEVEALIAPVKKSYDEYIAAARAKMPK